MSTKKKDMKYVSMMIPKTTAEMAQSLADQVREVIGVELTPDQIVSATAHGSMRAGRVLLKPSSIETVVNRMGPMLSGVIPMVSSASPTARPPGVVLPLGKPMDEDGLADYFMDAIRVVRALPLTEKASALLDRVVNAAADEFADAGVPAPAPPPPGTTCGCSDTGCDAAAQSTQRDADEASA